MNSQEVVAPPARAGMFVVLTVAPGSEDAVRDLLADSPSLARSVGFRSPEDDLICVLGIGAALWDRLYSAPRPRHLHPLEEIKGAVHTAVSTPGDLLIHLRAARSDLCFELARLLVSRLAGHATVVDEVHGFRYFDERDLLGFVDGSENPQADRARAAVTITDDGDYNGGSYVVVQKYLHDLAAWQGLSVEHQEAAVGRSKVENVEMSDDTKPSNSHIALNTLEDAEGNQLQILRDNLPFGRVGSAEYGTYFIGYAHDPGIIEQMLHRMFVGVPEGNHDRLLDFSTPVTGSLYFVPTRALLEDTPPTPRS